MAAPKRRTAQPVRNPGIRALGGFTDSPPRLVEHMILPSDTESREWDGCEERNRAPGCRAFTARQLAPTFAQGVRNRDGSIIQAGGRNRGRGVGPATRADRRLIGGFASSEPTPLRFRHGAKPWK